MWNLFYHSTCIESIEIFIATIDVTKGVWLNIKYFQVKIFLGKENIFKCFVAFQKMFWKIFSSVWLCCWKCFRKPIFIMFPTFSYDANKYYYRESKYINNTRNKNQNKKIKITIPIVREGQREIGSWVRLIGGRDGSIWRWWVDLGVGHSLGGSISSWVHGTISPVDEVGRSGGGFVARSHRCWGATCWCLDLCGWIGVT